MIAAGLKELDGDWTMQRFVCKENIHFHIDYDAHEDFLSRSLDESCVVVCLGMDSSKQRFAFETVSNALVFLSLFKNTQVEITEQEHVDLIDALPNNIAVCCGFGSGGCCLFPGENSLLVMYEFSKIRIKNSSSVANLSI